MSVTILQNIFRIRDLLDSPTPQKPGFHQLLRICVSEQMDITNALNNTGLPWGESIYTLQYHPGQTEYSINVGDFGKVIFVTKVVPGPYIFEVPVPYSDRNHEHYGTVWMDFVTAWGAGVGWLSETLEHMSFYRDGAMNPQPMVSIQPAPQQSWTYKIHYMPGYIAPNYSLETAVQLPEHQELLRLRAAMAALNYSEWGDDMAFNRQKRLDLAQGFQYQLDRKEKLFANYITSINVPRTVEVSDWAGDYRR